MADDSRRRQICDRRAGTAGRVAADASVEESFTFLLLTTEASVALTAKAGKAKP